MFLNSLTFSLVLYIIFREGNFCFIYFFTFYIYLLLFNVFFRKLQHLMQQILCLLLFFLMFCVLNISEHFVSPVPAKA